MRNSKKSCNFATLFWKQKYQRLRHYFCAWRKLLHITYLYPAMLSTAVQNGWLRKEEVIPKWVLPFFFLCIKWSLTYWFAYKRRKTKFFLAIYLCGQQNEVKCTKKTYSWRWTRDRLSHFAAESEMYEKIVQLEILL